MRRLFLLVPVLAVGLLVGCGGEEPKPKVVITEPGEAAIAKAEVKPKPKPVTDVERVRTVLEDKGYAVTKSDTSDVRAALVVTRNPPGQDAGVNVDFHHSAAKARKSFAEIKKVFSEPGLVGRGEIHVKGDRSYWIAAERQLRPSEHKLLGAILEVAETVA